MEKPPQQVVICPSCQRPNNLFADQCWMCFTPLSDNKQSEFVPQPGSAWQQTIKILAYVFGAIALTIGTIFAVCVALFIICVAVVLNA